MEEFLWSEKYRPHTIDDCILPTRIKDIFNQILETGKVPNLLLTGSAGTGKTTVARALCEELGLNHMFLNSSDERGIETLRVKIRTYASTMSLMGDGKSKVVILDEADYLTPEAQAALRGIMEEFSKNCTFIFTCNFKYRLIEALHSRTTTIGFSLQKEEKPAMAAQFYSRCAEILRKESVKFDKTALAVTIERHFPDFRRTINELQSRVRAGVLESAPATDSAANIKELVSYLKTKDFSNMKKWVAQSEIEPARMYRLLYDALYTYLKPSSIPGAVLTIAKYQYQASFAADQEINSVACMTELMLECEYV